MHRLLLIKAEVDKFVMDVSAVRMPRCLTVQQAAEYRKYRVEKRQTEYRHGDKKRQGRMNLEHAAYRDDRHRIAEEHRARITDEYLCGI